MSFRIQTHLLIYSLCILSIFAQEELGECIFERYPSAEGNPEALIDGSFESYRPLAQSIFSQAGLEAVASPGCVCTRTGTPPIEVIDLTDSFGYDDVTCADTCAVTKPQLGFLEGSNQYVTGSLNRANNRTTLVYVTFDATISSDFPNIRFHLGLSTPAPEDFVIQVAPTFNFLPGNPLLVLGAGGIPLNTTDCLGTKWSRYTISLLPMISDPAFNSLKGTGVAITFSLGPGVYAAIDNVEFVGPAITNETVRQILDPTRVSQSLPDIEFSFLGVEPLDQVVSVAVILTFIVAVVVTLLLLTGRHIHHSTVKVFGLFWIVASALFSIYAVIEYVEFVRQLNALNSQANDIIREVRGIVQTPGFDPRQLQFANNGTAVLGAFVNAIPSFSRAAMENVVTFNENSSPRCNQSRISSGVCFDTADAYYSSIDPNPVPLLSDFRNFSLLEGTVFVSLTHFLRPLLSSLSMDLIVTVVLVVVLLLNWNSTAKRVAEAILCFGNLIIALVILYIAVTEPVRYEIDMNLVDFFSRGAISVQPKETFRFNGGDFVMESSGFGVNQVCFNDTFQGQVIDQFSVYLQTMKLSQLDEFFPKTIGTEVETCKWNQLVTTFVDSGTICTELDCSGGVVSLIRAEALQPLQNFVNTRILFGIVLIDVFVSIVDALILIQGYLWLRQQRNALTLTAQDDKDAKVEEGGEETEVVEDGEKETEDVKETKEAIVEVKKIEL